jgi:hypothetical protein
MSDIKAAADATAQSALRAMNAYASAHGKRNALLDARYSAAERIVDAVEEYLDIDALVDAPQHVDEWRTAILAGTYDEPDIPLARTPDPGDIYVYPVAS